MGILRAGFEDAVRSNFGIDVDDLPNADINIPTIVGVAEAVVKKRIPDHASVVDETDLLFMEAAAVAYVCHLLAPSMARRLNSEVQTLDTRWKKDKTDWNERSQYFLNMFESSLSNITTTSVVYPEVSLVDYARNTRQPIGVSQ